MMNTTPRKVARIAQVGFAVTAPIPPAIIAAWATEAWSPDRPYLALMVFMFSVCAAATAGIVWSLAACHVAIASAFAAGVGVGRAAPPPAPSAPLARGLRAVE